MTDTLGGSPRANIHTYNIHTYILVALIVECLLAQWERDISQQKREELKLPA
jgi:hypothetical protein